MAATLKQEFKCAVELIPGGSGSFEVSVDGTSLFSKKKSVRFPKGEEIVKAVKHLRARTP